METRGERERCVKEMVREARVKFGTDYESIFGQIVPNAIALCGSRAIAEKLMFEGYCEILAEMLLGPGDKPSDLRAEKANLDKSNDSNAARLRMVVIISIVAALGAAVFWWFRG